MNWLDIALIGVVLVSAFIGWQTGVVRVVVVSVAIGAGIYLVELYQSEIAQQVSALIANDSLSKAAASAIIFMGVLVAAGIGVLFTRKILRMLFLGWLDSTAGGLLGIGIGVMLAGVAVFALRTYGMEEAVNGSSLGTLLTDNYPVILKLFPDGFKGFYGLMPPGNAY